MFFTTPVLYDTTRAVVAPAEDEAAAGAGAGAGGGEEWEEWGGEVAGAYVTPAALAAGGMKGVCVQSGTCTETSTNGSMTDLSSTSRPCASFGRGSCCAEMICASKEGRNRVSEGKWENKTRRGTHGHVEEVLRPFAQEVLVRGRAQREGLEDVPGPAVALEHRMVDHIPQICATHMSAHIQKSKK